MCVVSLVGAKSVGKWTICAGGVVGVVACGRMGSGGFCGGQLLMLLLLEQVVVPVVLLPLCVHDGAAGTRVACVVLCSL